MAKVKILPPKSATRTIRSCLARLIEFRTAEIEACRNAAYAGTIDGIHDMRVSCRRLQAVLRAFGSFIPGKTVKKFRRRLRALIRALGTVREYDVLISHIVRNVKAGSVPQQTALGLLIGRYSLLRTRAHGELTLALRAFDEKNALAAFRDAALPGLRKREAKPLFFGSLMQRVVPNHFLSFMVASTRVVNHPRRTVALHQLRIKGKPLRYAMELSQKCFGPTYERCYQEMKSVIELLGDIHDIDVTVSTLSSYLEEIRIFNTPDYPSSSISIQTGFLRKAIDTLKARRTGLFIFLGNRLLAWRREGFYGKLVRALRRKPRIIKKRAQILH